MTAALIETITTAAINERAAWRAAVHARLANGPASSHELIHLCGRRSYNDGARISNWLRGEPTIRKVGKGPGPTGHQNHFWALAVATP